MKIYTNKKISEMAGMLASIKASLFSIRNNYNELYAEYVRLQDENMRLRERINNMYWHNMKCPTHDPGDIIFPNTDERGLGEGDTPNDLSPLDL